MNASKLRACRTPLASYAYRNTAVVVVVANTSTHTTRCAEHGTSGLLRPERGGRTTTMILSCSSSIYKRTALLLLLLCIEGFLLPKSTACSACMLIRFVSFAFLLSPSYNSYSRNSDPASQTAGSPTLSPLLRGAIIPGTW